ncbi:MAG: sigma-70 region 4 domain-containing protein, partial [Duncaniella sp.]|nr:sigma-70 region 4 domain-containing protein [Duncaniella sp.]
LDERSYDEIADVTGMTRNNVATRLRRIKQRLIEQGKEDR